MQWKRLRWVPGRCWLVDNYQPVIRRDLFEIDYMGAVKYAHLVQAVEDMTLRSLTNNIWVCSLHQIFLGRNIKEYLMACIETNKLIWFRKDLNQESDQT